MKTSAYRGYLIYHNPIGGLWWIEKGAFLISWAKSDADARSIIDGLVA